MRDNRGWTRGHKGKPLVKTMASRYAAAGIIGGEKITQIGHVRTVLVECLPKEFSRLMAQMEQAQTADDLDKVEDAMYIIEDRLAAQIRIFAWMRLRIGAMKVDLMEKPEPVGDEEGGEPWKRKAKSASPRRT